MEVQRNYKKTDYDRYTFRAVCSKCGVTNNGSVFRNDAYNKASWNTRHIDQATKAQIEADVLRRVKQRFDRADTWQCLGDWLDEQADRILKGVADE